MRAAEEDRGVGDGRSGPELPAAGATGTDHRVEALYRDRFVQTARLAYLLTGDGDAADDLAQEAFARLYRCIGEVDNPSAFLRRTLVNLCHDHRRRWDTARRHPQPAPGPVDGPEVPRSLDPLWAAIQALPDRRRDAVVLRYYADLSTDQIAELLDVRPATVRSLLHRGLGCPGRHRIAGGGRRPVRSHRQPRSRG